MKNPRTHKSKFLLWPLIVLPLILLSASCNRQVQEQGPASPTASKTAIELSVEGQRQNQIVAINEAEHKTALDILKQTYQVETKTFSGLGEYVQGINGVQADQRHFWAFYINGQQSQVGAGQYQVKSDDKIQWRLEEIKN